MRVNQTGDAFEPASLQRYYLEGHALRDAGIGFSLPSPCVIRAGDASEEHVRALEAKTPAR